MTIARSIVRKVNTLSDLAVLSLLLGVALALTQRGSAAGLIGMTRRLALALPARPRSDDEVADLARRVDWLTRRASRRVPRTHCLHRAIAARLWLAARGVEARIVVGFRANEGVEGHAWVEIEQPTAPIPILTSGKSGFRRVFDETDAARFDAPRFAR